MDPTRYRARRIVTDTVRRALAEDMGNGDLTATLIPENQTARAQVVTREDAILCGCAWFDEVFRQLDTCVRTTWKAPDGEAIRAGRTLCQIEGPARAILTGERTGLNFLQTLSGVATRTRAYVDAIRGTRAIILDTRKTVPGLRLAQKYAVRCGGGQNHRLGLYDGILIKENHIAAAGSIVAAIEAAKASAAPGLLVEIEVENLRQLREALAAGAQPHPARQLRSGGIARGGWRNPRTGAAGGVGRRYAGQRTRPRPKPAWISFPSAT